MKLLVDQNLPAGLVAVLREAGHDTQHTQDLELGCAPDPVILERCCHDGRTLITADKKLTKFLASSGARCPSVVITRDVRTMITVDLGRLIVANLPTIAQVIGERGDAVFVLAPSRHIRASVLPLVPFGKA